MKTFGTYGPVNPREHYVVSRTAELADFINRVKQGRYIVIFAPRQTGKTTFFQWALEALAADPTNVYFPIELNFEVYEDYTAPDFYVSLYQRICREILRVFRERQRTLPETLRQLLADTALTDHIAMMEFFEQLAEMLAGDKIILIIDEFDGIPRAVVSGFLHALRHIYVHSARPRCLHSVGIVGVKNIMQLNLNRSISPFNIQDEFELPNFTCNQVQQLLGQYTAETGQPFASGVSEAIHKQTAGQPLLVNRFAQILTEQMTIPKSEPITMEHFSNAHGQLLLERNTNIEHLVANIRKDRRFEDLLMKIVSYDEGIAFNPYNETISELATYGVITKGSEGRCEIVNPIYYYCIMQTFKPTVNGLERDYFSDDTGAGFQSYLTRSGHIRMQALLDNFRDFIARVGFKILQVPETPQEYVGQYLLFAYLEQCVQSVGGMMYLEVQTGRGRMDILVLHNRRKYIVETKIWGGNARYQAGKVQLAAYLKQERAAEGYYLVFDHRAKPEPCVETETIDGLTLRSYVIPVVQEVPSQQAPV